MSNNGLGNLDDLFQHAANDGLTDDTLGLVISNLNGPTMTQAVGVSMNDLATSEVTLAMNIIDMSGSMGRHANDLTRAYNDDYLTLMRASPAADDILVSTILFNHEVTLLHGYVDLDDAKGLTPAVYRPRGTTALYDAVAGGITNMVLYAQQLRQSGLSVRCIIIVYTDGQDTNSKQRPSDIKRTVDDLMRQEIYTFAFVGFVENGQKQIGFQTGQKQDPVRRMADEMGFQEAMTAGLSASELGRIFYMASQSTVQVSRSGMAGGQIFTP